MLDSALFRTDDGILQIIENLRKRNESKEKITEIQKAVEKRRNYIIESENLQAEKNKQSRIIGELKTAGNNAEFEKLKEQMKAVSDKLKELKEKEPEINNEYNAIISSLPNLLDSHVPEGPDESGNREIFISGKLPEFPFEVKPHYEVAEKLNLIDFERGVKLSGSRFYIYNEKIAQLERKLANFMLELHARKGYKERNIPLLVKDDCMFGTGQYPKFKDEYYRSDSDELSLIPTGEVPLTNIYADEILDSHDLPIKLTAFTPCFRREAGSAGKDTRGLIRVHQFYKTELVTFCLPEHSQKEWEILTHDAEDVLKKLGLTYRKLLLCSGDTGFSSSITIDLEVYMPGLRRWVEISSCSNFKDFQSRRARIRYKNKETGKNELVHTINGSGVAAGRLVAALLEYHQNADNSIHWASIETLLKL